MLGDLGFDKTEEIAETSQSSIYRCFSGQEQMILKQFKGSHFTPEKIAAIHHEYNIAKLIDSEFVIKNYQLKRSSGQFGILMEDILGLSLHDYILETPFPLREFFSLAPKMVLAIEAIHQQGFTHKDINPRNFVYNRSTGLLKVIDFGISERLEHVPDKMMKTDLKVKGSIQYLAPEQTGRFSRVLDHRADFYALGATFYEMLLGQAPFSAEDAMGYIHAHIALMPPSLSLEVPEIPKYLDRLILKLLAKDPDDRYQSTTGLLNDLRKCEVAFEKGLLQEFTLGLDDKLGFFRIPSQLFGRELDCRSLIKIFNSSVNGNINFVTVTGSSGLGKSALINEIVPAVTEANGILIKSKFDQNVSDHAYGAFRSFLPSLVRNILAIDTANLEYIKATLQEKLGILSEVLVELSPDLQVLLGPQKIPKPISPREKQNQTYSAMKILLSVIASRHHPVVLILDDVQWADQGSLSLTGFLGRTDLKYVMVVLCYRPEEVSENHPLTQILKELQNQVSLHHLLVKPLSEVSINELLLETIPPANKDKHPLTQQIYHKTGGNPFFIWELLRSLVERQLICYENQSASWNFDLEAIAAENISSNVLEFLMPKIDMLTPALKKTMSLAACIGNSFDTRTLAITSQISEVFLLKNLSEGCTRGFIKPLSQSFHCFREQKTEKNLTENQLPNFTFKFRHDKFQEAFKSLLSEPERQEFSLALGRFMLKNQDSYNISEGVQYCNYAINFITDQHERSSLAKLNFQVAKQARKSGSYQSAYDFIQAAKILRADGPADISQNEATDIEKELFHILIDLGKFEEAEKKAEALITIVKSNLEQAIILDALNMSDQRNGNFDRAVSRGIRALSLMKRPVSQKPSVISILFSLAKILYYSRWKRMGTLPVCTNPDYIFTADLYLELNTSGTLLGNTNLCVFSLFKATELFFQKGRTLASGRILISCAIILLYLGLVKASRQFLMEGIKLLDEVGPTTANGPAINILSGWLAPFLLGIEEAKYYSERAIKECGQLGDYQNLSLAIFVQANYFRFSKNLRTIIDDMREANARIAECHYRPLELAGRGILAIYELYQQDDSEPEDLEDVVTAIDDINVRVVRAEYHLVHNHHRKLHMVLDKTFSEITRSQQTPIEIIFFAYVGLTYGMESCRSGKISADNIKRARHAIKIIRKRVVYKDADLKAFALIADVSEHLLAGKLSAAEISLRQLVEASFKSDFILIAAISLEYLGEVFLMRGEPTFANYHISIAMDTYWHWGAHRKVNDLRKRFNFLDGKSINKSTLTPSSVNLSSTVQVDFDSEALLKASTALALQENTENLLKEILRIVLSSAGATKGLLFIHEEEELKLAVSGTCAEVINIRLENSEVIRDSDLYPLSIIQYVQHSRSEQLLHNAAQDSDFKDSRYIKNLNVKSIYCIPLINQKQLIGIIYLENHVVSGIFTPSQQKLIIALATKAAISLKNMRYIDEVRKNAAMQGQMEAANLVQQALLPPPPKWEEVQITSHYQSADETGGDWFGFYEDDRCARFYAFIGDVTGHGISAALMTGVAAGCVQGYLQNTGVHSAPQDVLKGLASTVSHTVKVTGERAEKSMSMLFLCLDLSQDQAYYVNCGHIPFYLMRKGKTETFLSPGNLLGGAGNHEVNSFSFEMDDILFLHTDGLMENTGPTGSILKARGLKKILTNISDPELIKTRVLEEGRKIWLDHPPGDDCTVLIIKKVGYRKNRDSSEN